MKKGLLWRATSSIRLGFACLAASFVMAPSECLAASNEFVLIFPHDLGPSSEQHPNRADQGLWQWDPSGQLQRLATFLYNARPRGLDDFDMKQGEGSYLSSADGNIFFSGAPVLALISGSTGNVLFRSGSLPGDPSLGLCAVHGPALGEQEAQGVGFAEPGLLGLVGPGPRWDSTPCGFSSHLFWFRGLSGKIQPVEVVGQILGGPNEFVKEKLLAFDSRRQGLWLIPCAEDGCSNLVFVPLQDAKLRADLKQTYPVPPPGCTTFISQDRLASSSLVYSSREGSLFLVPGGGGIRQAAAVYRFDPPAGSCAQVGSLPPEGTPAGYPLAATSQSAPPLQQRSLIPVVVHASGRNGTFWRSTLWLYNPTDQTRVVTLQRLSTGKTQQLTLSPRASEKLEDALAQLGGGSQGDGVTHDAVVISSTGELPVVAASRAYTAGSLKNEGGASMGHAVPAVPMPFGFANHLPGLDYGFGYDGYADQGVPSAFLLDWRQPGRFRHNLGVVNTQDQELTVTLSWLQNLWRPPRESEPQASVTVPPRSVRLFAVESLFTPQSHPTFPAVLVVTAPRPAPVFLSQVDNLTGDATFVPYSSFTSLPGDDTAFVIPMVARSRGDNASFWQSALYRTPFPLASWLSFNDPNSQRYRARFYPEGTCNQGQPVEADIEGAFVFSHASPSNPESAQNTVIPDVVAAFAPCASTDNIKGGLTLRVGNWTEAYSRTFTTRQDGGTYGEMLPLYPERGYPEQHFAGIEVSPQFRINVGFFNAQARSQLITVKLFAGDGTLVAEKTLNLGPWQSLQQRLEDLFGKPRGFFPAGTYGLSVLPQADQSGEAGRSWAYVSLVDNITNDPTNWW